MTRRAHLTGLLGLATLSCLPPGSRAASDPPIPPQGIGRRIRHLSYSDQGGRPDGVQVMVNRGHVYVGHMFSDGVTILDAADPRQLKPIGFFTAGVNTRTHHLQVANDLLLLANGANIVAMQSYDTMRGYFENTLADSITERKAFRAGLSIHDISRPREMREIAFLEMPGFGINRLWWTGERYAYISAHFDGFTDHILCIVDLQDIGRPQIVSRWWLPGMHRAAGETSTLLKGRRTALHHMITAGDRGYAAWRDGGFTIHDISNPAGPKLLSHINWSPPFPGGTHTPLPLPGRGLAVVADEANAEKCAKGTFRTFVVDVRVPENPVPISTLPTPTDRDYCSMGTFGPHNLHENRPGCPRHHLLEQLEPFGAKVGRHYRVPSYVSARMREVRDQAGSDRIGRQDHDDGNRGCGALRFARPDRTVRDNHINLALDQVDGQLRYPSVIAAGGSPLDYHIASLDVSGVP